MNMIKCAALTCLAIMGISPPAHAAFQLIYVVVEVYDDGLAENAGVATSFHCSNNGGGPANARVAVRASNGTVAGSVLTQTIPSGGTVTFVTHPTSIFVDAGIDENLATGGIAQGRAAIYSETPAWVVCAADLLDAANATPIFMAPRRLIRMPRNTSGGED